MRPARNWEFDAAKSCQFLDLESLKLQNATKSCTKKNGPNHYHRKEEVMDRQKDVDLMDVFHRGVSGPRLDHDLGRLKESRRNTRETVVRGGITSDDLFTSIDSPP